MFTISCWLPWYYYCDVRLYYCDIRTTFISDNSTIWQNNSIPQNICNRKYTRQSFLLLPPIGYSIWGSENCEYEYLVKYSLIAIITIVNAYINIVGIDVVSRWSVVKDTQLYSAVVVWKNNTSVFICKSQFSIIWNNLKMCLCQLGIYIL